MSSTPTGVPIEDCGTCGHPHPITRSHCVDCGIASAFIDALSGMCLRCLNGPVPGLVECCASGRCEVCTPGFDWGRDG